MHPTIHNELARARIADLHRKAEQDRLARAARDARRPRAEHDTHRAPSRLAAVITGRVLALLAARRLRPARSQPGQTPDAAS